MSTAWRRLALTLAPALAMALSAAVVLWQRAERRREADLERRGAARERLAAADAALRADVEERYARCRADITRLHGDFMRKLAAGKGAGNFQKAREGAAFVCSGGGLCGWSVCAKLAYKMAVDKVKGTDAAERSVAAVLESRVLSALGNGIADHGAALAEYRTRVREEVTSFSADCCLRLKEHDVAVAEAVALLPPEVVACETKRLAEIERAVRELTVERELAAGGAVLTAAFAKSTCASIRKGLMRVLASRLAKIVARNVTSATVAGTAAVADGPLPIGDIAGGVIEVVGLGWTAWDLYRVTETLPGELEGRLMRLIEVAEEESLATCRRAAAAFMDESLKACGECLVR